jgi:diguanylate cyclase (GGDEF)-like protein
MGDQALRLIAGRLTEQVRKIDVVARFGGDEFVILLPDSDVFAARDVAERLRLSMESVSLMQELGPGSITISSGVAQALLATPELSLLIDRADQALYRAKQNGRNCVQTV